jgi:hypothetical protein
MSSSAMGLEADISRCQQLFEAKELVAEVVVSNTKHRDRNERTWEGKEASLTHELWALSDSSFVSYEG